MIPQPGADRPSKITVGVAELVVAALFVGIGAVVVFDSRRIGAGWADDGPQSGYFPFYVGALMALSGLAVFFHTLRDWVKHRAMFASVNQLRNVNSVLLPTTIYVAAIYLIGIYVASAIFIGWFMATHGGFRWFKAVPVAIGVPVALFMLFDKWFLVPLPKGPLERMLGY
jgi:hypothetical protein